MRSVLIAALGCALLLGCSSNDRTGNGQPQVLHRTRLVQIESDTLLVMSPEQARQFGTTTVRTDSAKLMLRVAGRVVAKAVVPADSAAPALLVFESNDAAQRYTEYLKARASFERSATQLARIREMAEHNAVSGKDLQQAALLDAESELRQSGLRPELLGRMGAGSVLVACDVPEGSLQYVQLGEQAFMSFAALPGQEVVGRVIELADAVDPTTRTVRVFILLPHAPPTIRPGMFATVRILKTAITAAIVPRQAVVVVEGQSYVFVRRDSTTFVRRAVTIAGESGSDFQISEGLSAGEQVVTTRAILLKGLSFGY
jgi:hypothetical protein